MQDLITELDQRVHSGIGEGFKQVHQNLDFSRN